MRHAFLLALLTAAGCAGRGGGGDLAGASAPAPGPTNAPDVASAKPPSEADPVSASIELARTRVRPGEAFEISVTLDVAPLYEIYPLDASPPGVPTRLELELPSGFQPAGAWTEPPTVRTQGPRGHRVHAGEVRFVRRIRVTDGASPGDHRVTCSIRYQACDERQCLAPASFALSATVSVVPGT